MFSSPGDCRMLFYPNCISSYLYIDLLLCVSKHKIDKNKNAVVHPLSIFMKKF